MILSDLSRLTGECAIDIAFVDDLISTDLPNRKTRLQGNLSACDENLTDEQKASIENTIETIDRLLG